MIATITWYDPSGGVGGLVTEDGVRYVFDKTALRGGPTPKAGDRAEVELIGGVARRYVVYVEPIGAKQ